MLLESLIENKTLKHLNIEKNHLRKLNELKVSDLEDDVKLAFKGIKNSFTYFKQLENIESLRIASWIFNYMEYPDEMSKEVKEVKELFSGKLGNHEFKVSNP